MLKLNLLGTPQIHLDGVEITTQITGQNLALLAYLVITQDSYDRSHLAGLMWPDIGERQARANLRYRLYALHKVLGKYLDITRRTVAFNRQLPYWLDVEIFATHLENQPIVADLQLWQQTFDLYRDEFCAGCVFESSIYEDWLATQRQRLHEIVVKSAYRLGQRYWEENELERALSVNQSLLMKEPWHEEAHRQRMELLDQSGRRSDALFQYEQCRQLLADELGVEPSEETVALYHRLKYSHTNTMFEHFRADLGIMPKPSQFCGRRVELAALRKAILQDGRGLVALVGLGGMGKTALAAQFVQELVQDVSQPYFDQIIWRSSRHISSIHELLADWLRQLTHVEPTIDATQSLPANLEQQISQLLLASCRKALLIDP